jgi:hypothetical protein
LSAFFARSRGYGLERSGKRESEVRIALSALAALMVVVAVALLAKSAKAYGGEEPALQMRPTAIQVR